jgi:hypothetical protein
MIQKNSRRALTPMIGILVFALLYIIATTLYPGGNQANANAIGFSWLHNYWCNLLNEKAINGAVNTARPVALIAMMALCIALASFWYLLATALPFSPLQKKLLLGSGISSAIAGIFIFTPWHDAFINISGIMAIVAFVLLMLALYKNKWRGLFYTGIFSLVLILLNNYIYYTKNGLMYLPVVQKITFLIFLGWLCSITLGCTGWQYRPYKPQKALKHRKIQKQPFPVSVAIAIRF